MNWRRGLLRLWLVASALWVACTFWWREGCLIPAFLGGGDPWCSDPMVEPLREHIESAVIILGIPAAAIGAGVACIWIFRALDRDSN
jgi:hypothetical protein